MMVVHNKVMIGDGKYLTYAVAVPKTFVNDVMQIFKHKFFIGGLMESNIFLSCVLTFFFKNIYIKLNLFIF